MAKFFKPSATRPKSQKIPKTLEVTDLASDGRGIARNGGKVVFVSGALPTETITPQHYRRGSSHDSCETKAIAQSSAFRITPRCQHFDQCGGCQLQHLAHPQQVEHKQRDIIQRLTRAGVLQQAEVLPAIAEEGYGYRSRVKFVLNSDKHLCFRYRESDKLVPIDRCPVLTEPLQALQKRFQRWLDDTVEKLKITHVELLDSEGVMALVLRVLRPLSSTALESLLQQFADVAIYQQTEKKGAYQAVNAAVTQALQYSLADPPVVLRYQPGQFTQVNCAVNEVMVKQAVEWLQADKRDVVVDLFCGIGNFTIPLGTQISKVVGIELDSTMVEQANQNGADNQAANVQFFSADLQKGRLAQHLLSVGCTKLLIDPPRSGAKEICEQIGESGVLSMIYVSCNPSTFIRDAKQLNNNGYELKRLRCLDMFPQTAHMEIIAQFSRVS